MDFLQERGLWSQFSKITLGDLRRAFAPSEEKPTRKRKRKILEDELAGDVVDETIKLPIKAEPDDGGLSTDDVARIVLPFVEGNGDVALDDIAEYSRLDRKVLRHHLGRPRQRRSARTHRRRSPRRIFDDRLVFDVWGHIRRVVAFRDSACTIAMGPTTLTECR